MKKFWSDYFVNIVFSQGSVCTRCTSHLCVKNSSFVDILILAGGYVKACNVQCRFL